MRAFCDPALLAELAELERSIAEVIETFGCDAIVQGIEPSNVRSDLEADLLTKLQKGALLATCALEPPPQAMRILPFELFGSVSERKLITPVQWSSLVPDFNDSSAKDWKKNAVYSILVFERSRLVGKREAAAPTKGQPPAKPQPRAVVFRKGFTEVRAEGKIETFGPIQAKALAVLHQASLDGEGWLSANDLLTQSYSQASTVNDLFRSKDWRLLIEQGRPEDGHGGQLRLRSDTIYSFQDNALG